LVCEAMVALGVAIRPLPAAASPHGAPPCPQMAILSKFSKANRIARRCPPRVPAGKEDVAYRSDQVARQLSMSLTTAFAGSARPNATVKRSPKPLWARKGQSQEKRTWPRKEGACGGHDLIDRVLARGVHRRDQLLDRDRGLLAVQRRLPRHALEGGLALLPDATVNDVASCLAFPEHTACPHDHCWHSWKNAQPRCRQ